jgi:maleate isomerase
VDAATLRAAVAELDGETIDAIVQVGTNLAMRAVAEEASAALGKPVLAVNAVTYRNALARVGAAS